MIKLTVGVTTYNRWELCFQTLDSIVRQECDGIEIILVDDCSSDPIPKKIKLFLSENNITYIRHEENRGLAAARNSAIFNSKGKYFSFCDDDDVWPQTFANKLISTIEASSCDVCIALSDSINRNGKSFFNSKPKLQDVILAGYTPPVSSQIYLTENLREINGYNVEIKSGVDHDLWISLAKINPRVTVVWGESATPGRDVALERMTTVELKRRKLIAESLQIWKPQLIEIFGEGFNRHFCSSYTQYLDFQFFLQNLKKHEYLQLTVKLFSLTVLMKVIILILRKFSVGKNGNSFPEYKNS